MGDRVVRGEFALEYRGQRHGGSRPDGDSMWFKPTKKASLNGLGGRDADLNAGGYAQLRFEGIDALERHYGPNFHQAPSLGKAARDFLPDDRDDAVWIISRAELGTARRGRGQEREDRNALLARRPHRPEVAEAASSRRINTWGTTCVQSH